MNDSLSTTGGSMINDDVLIKVARKQLGHLYDWPDVVVAMKSRLEEIKLGFTGIRNDHLSLINFNQLKQDDLFIVDSYFGIDFTGPFDEAPIMLHWLENNKYQIEGIGCGLDSIRDPDRIKFRWKDIIDCPNLLPENHIVFRFDARPRLVEGGKSHYFMYKSYRDNRL